MLKEPRPKLSRAALLWLVAAAVLGALVWKLAEGHLGGAPSPLAQLTPQQVRSDCLKGLSQNLGSPVETAGPEQPSWDGQRWHWTSKASLDGDPLRFSCTLVGGGVRGARPIIRVLN